jgi:hypothetical protein
LVEARRLLEEGRRRFPEFRAIIAFLALVAVSERKERDAIDLLFATLIADGSGDGSIDYYRRALTWYASEIRADQP